MMAIMGVDMYGLVVYRFAFTAWCCVVLCVCIDHQRA